MLRVPSHLWRPGVQMEMTAPVLVKIPEETKMWEPAVYTLNFPLPAAYQDEPPAPTNDKVSRVWVRLLESVQDLAVPAKVFSEKLYSVQPS